MCKKTCFSIAMIIIFFTCISVSSAGPLVKEGMWEITSQMEIPGMPVPMPPITFKQCMTKQNPVPHQSQSGQECHTKNIKTKGNTVSWDMICDSPEGKMKSSGKITYQGDRFNGIVMTDIPGQGQMKMTMTGRHIGKCNK
ncbi:MAG: DUF3617 domain-containing protein [Deltaproteobacteria bacterium]|nr:DUF3617 domain-containing protein [Deltaproteobacteria bacterium]